MSFPGICWTGRLNLEGSAGCRDLKVGGDGIRGRRVFYRKIQTFAKFQPVPGLAPRNISPAFVL